MQKDSGNPLSVSAYVGRKHPDITDKSHGDISNFSLPLINTGRSVFDTNSFGNNSYMNTHNYGTKKLGISMNNNMDTIKLSNKLTMSLKTTIDALDIITEYEEKMYEENLNMVDILKQRREEDKTHENALEDINQFNLSIIKNTQWGVHPAGKLRKNNEEGKPFVKPNRKELEREMGILNI